MDVYEYVVVLDPTEKEKEEGIGPRLLSVVNTGREKLLICSPQLVMAASADKAREIAVSRLDEADIQLLDRIRILVRPFA